VNEDYKGQRVLVTGGAGVIGSVLISTLVDAGAHILCCDLKPRPAYFGSGVRYIHGDANYLTYDQVRDFSPAFVFHLAATFERSVETEEFWWENYWHNIRLSNHLMSLVKSIPSVRRVVFASSYLIYNPALYSFAEPQTSPTILREDTPIYPRNICGAAKLLHELELRFLDEFETCNFTTISARIFRVYGKHSRDIVSRWIRTLVQDPQSQLEVYRGEGIFDYIYAGDVAHGLMRLGASEATGISNLGSGQGRTVFDLVEILRGHFPLMRTAAVDVGIDYEAHQADLTRLESTTGWRPPTTLEAGISLLIDHYRGSPEELVEDDAEVGVLISSASRKVPLVRAFQGALLRTMQTGHVVAGDLDSACIAGHFADEAWAMPRLDQLSTDALIAECHARKIKLIVPTRDGELEYYARARPALEAAGIAVHVAAPDQVSACLDKLVFYRRCAAAGIPAIETYACLEEVPGDGPVVVKERFGAGSRTLGLGLDRASAAQHAAALSNPIFQPLVTGDEHSIDLYVNRSGEVVEVVPRRRTQVFHGESAVSETVEAPALVAASIALAGHFELRGHNVLQAFVQVDGSVVFIECNPRVGGASSLSFEAGLDTPHWSLMEAAGQRVTPRVGLYRRGLTLIRYSADRFLSS
jgi:carbamoyl-phosphate synthase large subunit